MSLKKKIVILGATSAIAQSTARLFAKDGCSFLLVGRDKEKLDSVKRDLITRGAESAEVLAGDLGDCSAVENLFSLVLRSINSVDLLFVAYGSLGDQAKCEKDVQKSIGELETNFLSVVSWLTHFANYFEDKKAGSIAVIGSVAGDRGRKKNYVYGAAKAGLETFLSGLRNRLYSSNVNVLTIKPGFVDTPMTSHLPKGPLFASSNAVAKAIYEAISAKSDIIYAPWFWRFIMTIICCIPERVFKRLNI